MDNSSLYRLLAANDTTTMKNMGADSKWSKKALLSINTQGANDFRWLTDIVKCDWKELFKMKRLYLSDNELSLAEKARIETMLPNCTTYF